MLESFFFFLLEKYRLIPVHAVCIVVNSPVYTYVSLFSPEGQGSSSPFPSSPPSLAGSAGGPKRDRGGRERGVIDCQSGRRAEGKAGLAGKTQMDSPAPSPPTYMVHVVLQTN